MRVLVTGADGFLGRALVHVLRVGHEVVATDRDDGDIADPGHVAHLFAAPIDRVFHLAAIVSGAAESDFAAGQRVNLGATVHLLERCRLQAARGGGVARFVYASSIAVFGTPLPERIDDRTAPAPSLSYGTHKRVGELLVDDASRRGELDGRALRLPGVVVRPALPNGALSAFNSDLVREPLAGHLYECPVGPEATIWVTSRRAAIANLLRLGEVDAAALGAQRAVTARALALSVAEIVAGLGRVDPAAPARVRYRRKPAIEAQFGRWPRDCTFARADALGLVGEASIDTLIRDHLESMS
jgi:nucleoside-diphosphate-sugar epimerase